MSTASSAGPKATVSRLSRSGRRRADPGPWPAPRSRLAASDSPGTGTSAPDRRRPGPRRPGAPSASTCRIWTQVAEARPARTRSAASPMTPSPTATSEPTALGLVPVAGDREQPAAVLVEPAAAASARSRTARPARRRPSAPACRGRAAAQAAAELGRSGRRPSRRGRWRGPTGRPAGDRTAPARCRSPGRCRPSGAGRRPACPSRAATTSTSTPQPVEHRTPPLGALVAQRAGGTRRRSAGSIRQHAGLRVLDQVLRRLREELVRQRDPLVVDHADLGQVGDVRDAVGRAVAITAGMAPSKQRREVEEAQARPLTATPTPPGRRRPGPASGRTAPRPRRSQAT